MLVLEMGYLFGEGTQKRGFIWDYVGCGIFIDIHNGWTRQNI
jgi:hypothetical protein